MFSSIHFYKHAVPTGLRRGPAAAPVRPCQQDNLAATRLSLGKALLQQGQFFGSANKGRQTSPRSNIDPRPRLSGANDLVEFYWRRSSGKRALAQGLGEEIALNESVGVLGGEHLTRLGDAQDQWR